MTETVHELQMRVDTGGGAADIERIADAARNLVAAVNKAADGLDSVAKSADSAGDESAQSAKQMDKVAASADRADNKLDEVAQSVDRVGDQSGQTANQVAKMTKSLDRARDSKGRFIKASDSASDSSSKLAFSFGNLFGKLKAAKGQILAVATALAVVVAPFALATRAAAQFETGLVGVGKTADIQGAALLSLGDDIDSLSRRIPVASDELLGIAQSAGQLGVQGADNILEFTETVALLGQASDLAGAEGAAALAQILTVSGESASTVGTLASVIVALGNNFAATERKIARHTGEIGRALAVYDVGSAQAAAFATTLAAFGVQAELAGSAMGRSFRAIEAAVRAGGDELKALDRIAAGTAEELVEAFGRDPVEAFGLFLEGLRDIKRSGGDTTAALASVGLKGQELLKVIPVLAKEYDTLARAQGIAAAETENATALQEEAARGADTLASDFQILRNEISSAAKAVGEEMAPAIREVTQQTTAFIAENRELFSAVGILAGGIVTLTSEVVGLTGSILSAITGYGALKRSISESEAEIAAAVGPTEELAASWEAIEEAVESADRAFLESKADELTDEVLRMQGHLDGAAFDVRRFKTAIEQANAEVAAGTKTQEEATGELASYRRGLELASVRQGTALGEQRAFEQQLSAVLSALSDLGPAAEDGGAGLQALAADSAAAEERMAALGDLANDLAEELQSLALAEADAQAKASDNAEEIITELDIVNEARARGIDLEEDTNGALRAGIELLLEARNVRASILQIAEEQAAFERSLIDEGQARGAEIQIDRAVSDVFDGEEFTKTVDDAFGPDSEMARAWIDAQDQTNVIRDEWIAIGDIATEVLFGIDEGLGNIAGAVTDIGASLRSVQEADSTAGRILAGAQTGASIAGLAQSFGLFQGQRGIGQFGGELSGDFSTEGGLAGGAIGAAIGGPVGAAIGGALGTIVGGLIKSGADEFLATLTQVGDNIETSFDKVEGGLRGAGSSLVEGIVGTVDELERIAGGEITTGEFGVKIRDDVVTVFINGIREAFKGDTAIEDAVEFAILELLSTAGLDESIGSATRQVLSADAAGSLEELSAALELASALDNAAAEAGPFAAALDGLIAQQRDWLNLAKQFGVSLSEVLSLSNDRIGALSDEADAARRSALGASDTAEKIKGLVQAYRDVNRGIDEERTAREKQLAAALRRRDQLQVEIDAAEAAESANRGAEEARQELTGGLRDLSQEWTGQIVQQRDLQGELAAAEEEAAALADSLGGLPEALDMDELADAVNALAAEAGLSLADQIERLGGAQLEVAERQELLATLEAARLAASIASVQLILETTEQLGPAMRGVLEGVVAKGEELLGQLASGEIEISTAGGGGSGRIDRFAEAVQTLASPLDRARQAAADMADSVSVLARAQERGRVSAAEAARIMEEFGGAVETELFGLAESILQTMGQSAEAAEFSRDLRQAEFDLQVAQLRLIFEQANALGFLSEEAAARIAGVLEAAQGFEIAAAADDLRDFGQELAGVLPSRQAREDARSYRDALGLINEALREGELSARQAAAAQAELRSVAFADIGGQLLSFVDRYYDTIEGGEELRIRLAETQFALELASLQVQFEILRASGVLAADVVELISGVIEEIRDNPPDFAALFDEAALAAVNFRSILGDALAAEAVQRYADELDHLDELLADGAITAQRRAAAERELGNLAFADLGGRILGLAGSFLDQIEGGERLRSELEQARFAIELAQVELQFALLQEMGLLTQSQIELIGGVIVELSNLDLDTAGDVVDSAASSIIDSLLPSRQARADARRYRDALGELNDELRAGEITARQRAAAERELSTVAFADFAGDLLSFVDQYYDEIEGGENLRRRLEQVRFELEFANLQLQFRILEASGILAADTASLIEGVIAEIRANPPDFSAGGQSTAFVSRGGGRAPTERRDDLNLARTAESIKRAIDGLVPAVRDLADGARDLLRASQEIGEEIDSVPAALRNFGTQFLEQLLGGDIEDFDSDTIAAIIAKTEGITDEFRAVLEILGQSVRLEEEFELARQAEIESLLKTFDQGGGGLSTELESLAEQFAQAEEGLELLGGSAEDFAALAEDFGAAVQAAIERNLAGLRSLREEIEGEDVRISTADRFTSDLERFRLLEAQILAGDFSRIEEFEGLARELLGSTGDFLGSGGAAQDIRDEIVDAIGAIEGATGSLAADTIEDAVGKSNDLLADILGELRGEGPGGPQPMPIPLFVAPAGGAPATMTFSDPAVPALLRRLVAIEERKEIDARRRRTDVDAALARRHGEASRERARIASELSRLRPAVRGAGRLGQA